jgi:uncharacterized membrane protein affecting hemolysin expression
MRRKLTVGRAREWLLFIVVLCVAILVAIALLTRWIA